MVDKSKIETVTTQELLELFNIDLKALDNITVTRTSDGDFRQGLPYRTEHRVEVIIDYHEVTPHQK